MLRIFIFIKTIFCIKEHWILLDREIAAPTSTSFGDWRVLTVSIWAYMALFNSLLYQLTRIIRGWTKVICSNSITTTYVEWPLLNAFVTWTWNLEQRSLVISYSFRSSPIARGLVQNRDHEAKWGKDSAQRLITLKKLVRLDSSSLNCPLTLIYDETNNPYQNHLLAIFYD